jgi:tRNA threonylcarbamoyladenosine biosynthesis protein TsaB
LIAKHHFHDAPDMKILALDTATVSCSVAVVEGANLLGEVTSVTGQTHSRHLMRMVREVLELAGMTMAQLDGLAVTQGPGSFTGLRIGISTVKGLAVATGKPAMGVNCLDALATQVESDARLICPLIDARRNELYYALYRPGRGGPEKIVQDQTVSAEELLDSLEKGCTFVGNGALRYRDVIHQRWHSEAGFAASGNHLLRAYTVARLALNQYRQGAVAPVEALKPHYIRKADARIPPPNQPCCAVRWEGRQSGTSQVR